MIARISAIAAMEQHVIIVRDDTFAPMEAPTIRPIIMQNQYAPPTLPATAAPTYQGALVRFPAASFTCSVM